MDGYDEALGRMLEEQSGVQSSDERNLEVVRSTPSPPIHPWHVEY